MCVYLLLMCVLQRVTVSFVNIAAFSLEDPYNALDSLCDQDWVQLFDGPSLAAPTFARPAAAGLMQGQPARFCSANSLIKVYGRAGSAAGGDAQADLVAPKAGETFTSSGTTLTIWFHTSPQDAFLGFALQYSVQ